MFWNICSFVIITFSCQASARIHFDQVEGEDNPDYITSNYAIDNTGNLSSISGNFTIRKELNYKITLKLDIYSMAKQPVFRVPKINYCDAVKNLPTTEAVEVLMGEIVRSGVKLGRCPLKVGFYQVENLKIDDKRLPKMSMVRVTSYYRYQAVLQDENGKTPVVVSKIKGLLTIVC